MTSLITEAKPSTNVKQRRRGGVRYWKGEIGDKYCLIPMEPD